MEKTISTEFLSCVHKYRFVWSGFVTSKNVKLSDKNVCLSSDFFGWENKYETNLEIEDHFAVEPCNKGNIMNHFHVLAETKDFETNSISNVFKRL